VRVTYLTAVCGALVVCMWLWACWAHIAAEPARLPVVGAVLVAVLRPFIVYHHSAMYCLITCTHARGWHCVFLCVWTGLLDCWLQVLLESAHYTACPDQRL
jgi:hypothetical protein